MIIYTNPKIDLISFKNRVLHEFVLLYILCRIKLYFNSTSIILKSITSLIFFCIVLQNLIFQSRYIMDSLQNKPKFSNTEKIIIFIEENKVLMI